jgi:hypothetical protein
MNRSSALAVNSPFLLGIAAFLAPASGFAQTLTTIGGFNGFNGYYSTRILAPSEVRERIERWQIR